MHIAAFAITVYWPAAQFVQAVKPVVAEYLPAAHAVQVVIKELQLEVQPLFVEYAPAAHAVQV